MPTEIVTTLTCIECGGEWSYTGPHVAPAIPDGWTYMGGADTKGHDYLCSALCGARYFLAILAEPHIDEPDQVEQDPDLGAHSPDDLHHSH